MVSTRIEKLVNALKEKNLLSAVIFKPENIFYLCNYTGEGFLLVTETKMYIFTDFRYVEQAKKESPHCDVIEYKPGVSSFSLLAQVLKENNILNTGIEENVVTLKTYEELNQNLEGIEIGRVGGLVEKIRMIKEEEEIDNIKTAQRIADMAFIHILDYIKPGVSEKEISLELEFFIKKNGAQGLSFPTIVATGERASLPHGEPTERKLKYGDFITLDFGAKYNHYCSDMTRTVFLGKPGEEQIKIYRIVREAQEKALEYIKAGILGKDADKIARDIIENNGFGSNFGHGLGHGVGLEIHEEPRLSKLGEEELKPGMVVTVEPGIYIENFGGVRIEDLVVITEHGIKNLTKSSKDLIIL
ncbi:M24 family metallopeptidase [Thermovenabulum gondwanense]|uniref:Aminopeptidase YpdF n=1 Tax=Thermovenabulum gondwanense TaxID=520767 RepID=A0A161PWS7_9FIRM|nr:Xaa-Pro peptidase family protein [Thermovenabulum gondwanense]KYO65830.1 Aminopeptidase YpdF [Thermovenabulum gondwanense]